MPTNNESAKLHLGFLHNVQSQVDYLNDQLEGLRYAADYHATNARHFGATWVQIGEELNISKQAAEQRYKNKKL